MQPIVCPYDLSAALTPEQERIIVLAGLYLREISGFRTARAALSYDRRFYVYAILEPNGRAGYIGKGVADRWFAHERETSDPRNRSAKHKWIRGMWRAGERPLRCKIADHLLEDDAWALELELTQIIGLDNLKNESHGGRDPFVGMTPARIKYIKKVRARLQIKRTKEKPSTQYIQEVCARHPQQTAKELKAYLIANNIPWTSGREATKAKGSMMTLIRQGADEMFAVLGITDAGALKPGRLFLQQTAIAHPEWPASYCIDYARENGPDPQLKADEVIVTDMRGVLKKYAVISEEAKYTVPLRPEDDSDQAPDTDPELEGLATGLVEFTSAQGPGGNWHPDLPEAVLEVIRKPKRQVPRSGPYDADTGGELVSR